MNDEWWTKKVLDRYIFSWYIKQTFPAVHCTYRSAPSLLPLPVSSFLRSLCHAGHSGARPLLRAVSIRAAHSSYIIFCLNQDLQDYRTGRIVYANWYIYISKFYIRMLIASQARNDVWFRKEISTQSLNNAMVAESLWERHSIESGLSKPILEY